jgi:mono/diheme cytochrome c family protein
MSRERNPSSAARRAGALFAVMAVALTASPGAVRADDNLTPKRVFSQRCSACHTFGKGIKVGPDLKGVNDRHPRDWLLRFIRSSEAVIASGDAIAAALYEKFNRVRMPDWSDLSEMQVGAILDWFAADGPEQREDEDPSADLATADDIEAGRRLFHGAVRFAAGGVPCAGCHAIREAGATRGGSFAADLSHTYLEYQDRALALFMKKPCFPRYPESTLALYLSPAESFALRAYLRQAAFAPEGGAP